MQSIQIIKVKNPYRFPFVGGVHARARGTELRLSYRLKTSWEKGSKTCRVLDEPCDRPQQNSVTKLFGRTATSQEWVDALEWTSGKKSPQGK